MAADPRFPEGAGPVILARTAGWAAAVKPPDFSSEHGTEERPGFPDLLARALGRAPSGIYPVHRLDRGTGGLMVYALSRPAAARLSAAVAERRLEKTYLAVCEGVPEESGEWRDYLFYDRSRQKSYVVRRPRGGVKEAVLRFRRIASADGLSLLRIGLETGRTHQIRVQCASRGFPLAGDRKYGGKRTGIPCALWSARLSFPDPDSGENRCFTLEPPDEYPWSLFRDQLRVLSEAENGGSE